MATQERGVMTEVRKRLDMPYVERVAKAVAWAIDAEKPIQVAFQPGDGTKYRLLFNPLTCDRVAGRIVDGKQWEDHIWNDDESIVVCSWVEEGHGAYPMPGAEAHWDYCAEKWNTTSGSGATLAILFQEIAKQRVA